MESSPKLSLASAIFINLNVMIGAGIFINTYALSTTAGAAGFLLYPLVGLCMLPLIAVTGKLLEYFPTGGLYAFGSSYHPFLGFLSCWSYFFGKLASASVMLTFATAMFQQLIPSLQSIDPLYMSLVILSIFTFLNLQNLKTGMIVQTFFLTTKSIPILFACLAGVLLFDTSAIHPENFIWSGVIINIPLVLYCLAGFETACSLSRNIENPSVNGPKAVYYSFAIIMMLYGIFQGFVYMNTHATLTSMTSYKDIFPAIAQALCSSPMLAHKVSLSISFAMGMSALGGAYSILFANSWNLYTLAEHRHTFMAPMLTQLNKYQTPWVAVLCEAITCTIFLIFNQSSILPLQRTATLGIVIAYTISTFAYVHLAKQHNRSLRIKTLAILACMSCVLFVYNCATSFIQTGIAPLFLFMTILSIGTIMFFASKKSISAL